MLTSLLTVTAAALGIVILLLMAAVPALLALPASRPTAARTGRRRAA
jgi:hypothetical protein